jgi:hypothetical protein
MFNTSRKLAAGLVVATIGLAAAPAYANTTNPTSIKANARVNAGGTTTVTVSGNWVWPGGQDCEGRWGTSWAVGWWGTGTSSSPANNVTLTNATVINDQNQGINGDTVGRASITAANALKVPSGYTSLGGQNIYLGAKMNGQTVYTQSYCDVAQPSGKDLAGTYTASATYPSVKDVPSKICVVSYDIHGSAAKGKSAPTKDYDPVGNGDNSVAKKQFTPETNCVTVTFTDVPAGGSWGYLALVGLGGTGLVAVEARRRYRRSRLVLA